MSDDEPLAFNLILTLPDYNATKRHTVGGARGQMDIAEETVDEWERMVTHAVKHKGTIFAAVFVVVVNNEAEIPAPTPIRVKTWRERNQ